VRSPAAERRLLLVLILFAVAVGVVARIAHLDRKLFWQDESITALQVSGHALAEFRREFDGRVHPVWEIQSFYERDPTTGIATVVRTLAAEDPQHPPLFYVFDRLALDAAGGGAAATYRLPSVVFGILAIGFAFLLGTELYRSKTGGGILAALVALSPMHVLYARQAREYALFMCIVLASTFCLLRALDRRRALNWGAYAVTVSLGIYTDSIFGLVIGAHAVSTLLLARRDRRTLAGYALATAAGLGTFAPWGLNAVHSKGHIEGLLVWGANVYPVKFLAEKWAFNVAAVFFDAEFADLRLAFVAAIVLAIVLASIVAFARTAAPRERAIALPLMLIPIATFVAVDVTQGSHFSTIPRFLLAGWIGLEVIVASALVAAIAARARWALPAFAILVIGGAIAAYVDNGAENWWDNNNQVAYQAVARTIDVTPAPLVLDEDFYEVPLLLARYLRPDASFLLFHVPAVPVLPKGTRQAYLVIPSPPLLAAMKAREREVYSIDNVSPNATTIISGFHRDLASDKTFKPYDFLQNEQPGNALWSLRLR